MISYKEMQEIRTLLKQKYKSFSHPEFFFVEQTVITDPYRHTIESLKKVFDLEEVTDLNNDVCFAYYLNDRKWLLKISMIGPYALVQKTPEPLTPSDSNLSENEKFLFSVLAYSGVTVLDKETLSQRIRIKMFDTDIDYVCLYQALFTDDSGLPWEPMK